MVTIKVAFDLSLKVFWSACCEIISIGDKIVYSQSGANVA